ncbi:MAG: hypothetical protein AABM29_08365 [Actinomycetota bacterium]
MKQRVSAAVRDMRFQWQMVKAGILGWGEPPWPEFGQPFNGQRQRIRTVEALVDAFSPDGFIETGTMFGHTTAYLAGFGKPVYTTEMKNLFVAIARFRLRGADNAHVMRGHSARLLGLLVRERPFKRPFAYLDAHWWGDIPLNAEIGHVFGAWDDAIIAIDDFEVPGDHGYYHYAGEDFSLSLDALALPAGTRAAYPAAPSDEETGPRSGTVYLARGAAAGAALDAVIEARLLRPEPEAA